MRAAVDSAGGVVVTDLSAIDALGVVPRAKSFSARLASSDAVTTYFQDSLLTTERGSDERHRDRAGPRRRPRRRPRPLRRRSVARPLLVLRGDQPRGNPPVGRRAHERSGSVEADDRRRLDRRCRARHRRAGRPPRAARGARPVARRQLHPLRGPEGALRPRRDRPAGAARLPRRRFRGSRHLGRKPDRRRLQRLRLQRRRPRRARRLLQGSGGRPRRALDLDPLRARRRVLRPADRRGEHVDRGLHEPRRPV